MLAALPCSWAHGVEAGADYEVGQELNLRHGDPALLPLYP